METKEALMEKIEQLEAEVAELQEQLSARDALLSGTGENGWLISTANKQYNGVTGGVRFSNGRAFVPEREGSDKQVAQLVGDFGYQAVKMTAKEYKELGG